MTKTINPNLPKNSDLKESVKKMKKPHQTIERKMKGEWKKQQKEKKRKIIYLFFGILTTSNGGGILVGWLSVEVLESWEKFFERED